MKNLILSTAMIALTATTSVADSIPITNNSYAVITAVRPIYQNRFVTLQENVCRDVEVPVYESRHTASDGDVLVGAIVGGAIGNQFGSGSGKDAMTILGAILGANRASNKTTNEIVGYRVEQVCNRVSRSVNQPIVSGYHIEYVFNGSAYSQETSNQYTVGQRVLIRPSIR
jgi:uncharacterized protein YcfJ